MGGSQSLGGRHRNLTTTGRKSREPPQSPPDAGPSRRHAPRGLSSVSRLRRRRRRQADAGDGLSGGSAENNRLWLLADSPVVVDESAEVDLHSVHSSFRFSFGSQEEARAGTGTGDGEIASHPGATVLLLVDLEDDGEEDSKAEAARDQQWQPIESLERSISPAVGSLARFSYREIRSATRNFSRERELGRGALSRVYKGRIGARWRAVAIKRLEGHGRESAKAFCRELLIASSLSHPNVAPLIGFSAGPEGLYLVYKFVSGGSLDGHLHHHHGKRGKVLPWDVRYKVAVGVARAVEYLHYGTDKCVIHRDIKSSNILLTSKKKPKLCDFGLATWTYGPSQPFLCKAVKGTFGYLAPEYFQHGKLSDRTDVYAFGVVLLELITGRKAIDQSRPQGDENLVLWAKPLLLQGEGAIGKLVDPKLEPGSYPWSEVRRMVGAATACVNSQESARPSIEQVVGMLQGEEEMCADWSVFTGNSCLAGYGCQSSGKSDMKSHLALAMLGVSDAEEDDMYGR